MIDRMRYLAIIILGRKCSACGHPRRSDPAGSAYWYCPMCGAISAKYKSWEDYALKHKRVEA